jgi:4-amino-4-deoxy-L-arabinose transferase-like glycosyltransferase
MLAKRAWLLLFVAACAAIFYGLGAAPLLGADEPRYAQVAREMYARGDWVTPTLGGHDWFEKPALLYWMMAAGYRLFG